MAATELLLRQTTLFASRAIVLIRIDPVRRGSEDEQPPRLELWGLAHQFDLVGGHPL
jgi:hypothetical protein